MKHAPEPKLTRKENAALRPFSDLWYMMAGRVDDALCQLTVPDLQALVVALDKLTSTNCGWAIFYMRPTLEDAVKREMYRRVNESPSGLARDERRR